MLDAAASVPRESAEAPLTSLCSICLQTLCCCGPGLAFLQPSKPVRNDLHRFSLAMAARMLSLSRPPHQNQPILPVERHARARSLLDPFCAPACLQSLPYVLTSWLGTVAGSGWLRGHRGAVARPVWPRCAVWSATLMLACCCKTSRTSKLMCTEGSKCEIERQARL